MAPNTTTTWTVHFRSGDALANADVIKVTFDTLFTVPASPTVTLGTGFGGCTVATASSASEVVTITLGGGGSCSVAAPANLTLTIAGITNPVDGTYGASNFSVATTTPSQAAEHPSSPVIIASAVSDVTFVGASTLANQAGVTWTVGFTTSSSGKLTGSGVITVTFNSAFAVPASPTVTLGAGFSGGCSVGSASSSGAVVTIDLAGGSCTLAASTHASLTVAGITNPAAGSYPNTSFSVSTSADTTPTSPATNVNIGVAANGSGTMTVAPSSVGVSSTGNTLVFTYTATGGPLSSGELEIAVPAGWSAPSTTLGAAGYTTSTCGTVAVVGSEIEVTGVTLASGANCTITYGSEASGGPGATAPSTAQISTFAADEESSPIGPVAALVVSPQVAVGTSLATQIYGVDPIGTSIAISQAEFPTPGTAGAVVLARDDFFSDALAGGPLAALVGGPLLLTGGAPISATIDPRTLSEIQRVLPLGGTVYILGGDLAISPNVDLALKAAGYTVVREAGANLYDTAYLIALALGSPSTVFEATGLSYYDALSAVPAAIANHAAILLTDGNVQSYETGIYLLSHPGVTRYAIGGPLAAAGADPGATPVYGQNLFGTSAAVATTFFPGAAIYGAATSATFTDALGGGVFMATGGRFGPLLIVNPNLPLPSEILPYLASLLPGTHGYVFGGPLAISAQVVAALEAAVG